MKSFLLFGVLFTLSLSLVQCGLRHDQCYSLVYGTETKCNLDGSGYTRRRCNEIDRIKKIMVWQIDRETKCEKPKICRCFKDHDIEDECECINPRKRPKWPSVGILRWNGSAYYDNNWWVGYNNPRRAQLPGEIHINGNGTYLKKWSSIYEWPKKGPAILKFAFEIIIPNDDGTSFFKFQGNSSSKKCSKKKVAEGKSFYAMWRKPHDVEEFTLLKETTKTRSIYSQVWSTVLYGDSWKKYWEWTMDYYSKKDYAIPTRYIYQAEDGFDGEYSQKKYDYTFEEIRESDETFRVEEYCDNA